MHCFYIIHPQKHLKNIHILMLTANKPALSLSNSHTLSLSPFPTSSKTSTTKSPLSATNLTKLLHLSTAHRPAAHPAFSAWMCPQLACLRTSVYCNLCTPRIHCVHICIQLKCVPFFLFLYFVFFFRFHLKIYYHSVRIRWRS